MELAVTQLQFNLPNKVTHLYSLKWYATRLPNGGQINSANMVSFNGFLIALKGSELESA